MRPYSVERGRTSVLGSIRLLFSIGFSMRCFSFPFPLVQHTHPDKEPGYGPLSGTSIPVSLESPAVSSLPLKAISKSFKALVSANISPGFLTTGATQASP